MLKNREARIRFVKTDDPADEQPTVIHRSFITMSEIRRAEKATLKMIAGVAGAVAAVKVVDAACYIAVKHLTPKQ